MTRVYDIYNSLRSRYGLSGSALKVTALALMLTDHIAAMFLTGTSFYMLLRAAGRLAFPIFAFLVSEGMAHTRDIRLYAFRLAAFALISEIPYDLCLYGKAFYLGECNVFFTLLIPVAVEAVFRYTEGMRAAVLVRIAAAAAGMGAAFALGPDYGWKGVTIVACFYYLRDFYPLGVFTACAFMLFAWSGNRIQLYSALALPLLLVYNGKRGFLNTRIRSLAVYAFYPLHLFVLFAVKLAVVYIRDFGK